MSVRLEAFRIRGFGPFDREFAVDLTALSPTDRLVAICGENGAGKTTALELALPGAMYRNTPTRGSLVDLATARDAFLETRLVNGSSWTLRHLVDAVSRKSEALVLDADGAPVLPDSKVANFDRWAAQHMPAPEVFFASIFAPQGAGGFAAAKPTARKEILLSILGPETEQLESDAAHAREQVKASKAALATLEARIADERARGGDVSSLDDVLVWRRRDVENATSYLEVVRRELAAAEEAARQHVALEQRYQQTSAENVRLAAALVTARETVTNREKQVANNRAVLAEADTIRAAAGRLPALRAELERKRAEVAALDAEVRRHADAQLAASQAEAAAAQRAGRAETRLQGADSVAVAVAKLEALRGALKGAESDLAHEEESLEAVKAKRAAGTEGRLESALGTLRCVTETDTLDEARGFAQERLDRDAEQVTLAEELPQELKAQAQRTADYATKRREAEQALRTAETLASRAGDLVAAREELASAQADTRAAAERRQAAGAAKETALFGRDAEGEALGLLSAELASIEPLADKLIPLEKAEERLAERLPQLEAAKADVKRLEGELAALPELGDLPPAPDVTSATRAAQDAEAALTAAHRNVATAEQQLEQAKTSQARVQELEGARAGAEAELADWTRLAADLGRDGLQAMVIDGAIPEVNEITNDLLHAAFGPRFTVEVRTQAADAKGKRLLETLDVWVIDTGTELHKGREGLIETFSGGEKTILAEALSLALTHLACRQAGAERPTLIRDESAGQLSEANAPIWMAMLRRAADIIGVDRILFVNHNRQTWELADARIEVRS